MTLPFPNAEPCSRFCKSATSDEVHDLFHVFVRGHLYRMRNETVHAASPVNIATTPNKEFLKWASKDGIPKKAS